MNSQVKNTPVYLSCLFFLGNFETFQTQLCENGAQLGVENRLINLDMTVWLYNIGF